MKRYLIILVSFSFSHAAHASSLSRLSNASNRTSMRMRTFSESQASRTYWSYESSNVSNGLSHPFSPYKRVGKTGIHPCHIACGGYANRYPYGSYQAVQRMVLSSERQRQKGFRSWLLVAGGVAAFASPINIDNDEPVTIGFCPSCKRANQITIEKEEVSEKVNCVWCHARFGVDSKSVMDFWENMDTIATFTGLNSNTKFLKAITTNDRDALEDSFKFPPDSFLDACNRMDSNSIGWLVALEKWMMERVQQNINPRKVICEAAAEIRAVEEARYQQEKQERDRKLDMLKSKPDSTACKKLISSSGMDSVSLIHFLEDINITLPEEHLRRIEIKEMLETAAVLSTRGWHLFALIPTPTKRYREVELILQLMAIFSHEHSFESYPYSAKKTVNRTEFHTTGTYEPHTINLNRLHYLLDKVDSAQLLHTYLLIVE